MFAYQNSYLPFSEKLFQIRADADVKNAAREVIGREARIYAEPADFDADAAGKPGKTAVVAHRKFFFAQVVVAHPDTERLVAPQQEFAIENKVPEEIVHTSVAFAVGLFFPKNQHVVVLKTGVIIPNIPLVQVVRHNAKAKRQVAELLCESNLHIEGQILADAVVGGHLGAGIAQHESEGHLPRGVGVHHPRIGGQGRGFVDVERREAEADVQPQRYAVGERAGSTDREGSFGGRYFAGFVAIFVGADDVAVVHILQATVHRKSEFWQIVRIRDIAVLDVREEKIVLKHDAPIHRGIEGGGVGSGKGHVVVFYRDLRPTQASDSRRLREGQKLKYGLAARYLAVGGGQLADDGEQQR